MTGAINTLAAARDKVLLLSVLFTSQDADFNAISDGVVEVLNTVGSDLASISETLDELREEEAKTATAETSR
jgi:hypothetical protein